LAGSENDEAEENLDEGILKDEELEQINKINDI
jgi:hypothetical protein